MDTKIGIWIDSDSAKIVKLENGKESFKILNSNVEHFNIHGGARAKTPYGAQDAVSESKLLERKKHQLKEYFNEIKSEINTADQIAIFGPAETKISLRKDLEKDSELANRIFSVEAADSMTENQFVALVKEHFN